MSEREANPRPSLRAAATASVLTFVGGYVDAIGYLNLGHVYVANMSGNSVALGIHSGWLDWPQIFRHAWPIVSFLAGVLVSRLTVTWGLRRNLRPVAELALTLEALFLAIFIVLGKGAPGVFFCACAMGIQAATISHFDGITIHTSFVTGTLVKALDSFSDALWATWDRVKKPPHDLMGAIRSSKTDRQMHQFLSFAANWTAYLIGAACGAVAFGSVGVPAAIVAVGVVGILVMIGLRKPSLIANTQVRQHP
jgi:uncharacterized membrane protein YoaK (UPF0700 family)